MKPAIFLGHIIDFNAGALIRTAESFGINLVLNVGKRKKYDTASQGTSKHMIYKDFESTREFIMYCKSNNHSIVCLENIAKSVPLSKAKYPVNPVFVTGNEKMGVPKEIMEEADLIIKIPQAFSYCKCLNTSVACSIVIHDWFEKNIEERDYGYKKSFGEHE